MSTDRLTWILCPRERTIDKISPASSLTHRGRGCHRFAAWRLKAIVRKAALCVRQRLRVVVRLVLEGVPRLDVADGAALRAHHHRVRLGPTLEETDALEEIAGGDAGRGEDHVAARHLVQLEGLLDVLDPHLLGPLDLLVVARREAALHVAAHAA